MKTTRFILLLGLLLLPAIGTSNTIDSLLNVLDKAIAERESYEQQKLKHIALIKEELKRTDLPEEKRYYINSRLYTEYESYNCDSAMHYVDENLEIAVRQENKQWMNRTRLDKTHLLAVAGLYSEAHEQLKLLTHEVLQGNELVDYYVVNENLSLYQAEYAIGRHYIATYLEKANCYRDSILSIVPAGSYRHAITRAPLLIDKNESLEAIALLEEFLPTLQPDTRRYAVTSSILAFAHYTVGNREKEKEFRIRSAIADIRAAVKENYSLGALAELLYADGQLERANRYIKVSIEDANSYSTRLRSLQSSKMLPLIDRAYQQEKEVQQQKLKTLTVGVCLLSAVLLLAVAYLIRQRRKLASSRQALNHTNASLKRLNDELRELNRGLVEANTSQQHTNLVLRETNRIKEEYLGRFLGLCSSYIDKLEKYRRELNKYALVGNLDELYRALKSPRVVNDELKEFYHNFDSSFLRIFPTFIEEFNKLLPEEERLQPKNNELLTTEQRIFALIRLGIADSARIAEFLRCSITTVYTYRSKVKNKSLVKDEFEERITHITSY